MTALLEFDHVSRTYGAGDAIVRALDDVSFTIHDGELVALMGASGSGKSTALSILGALDLPSTGTYRFRGADVSDLTADQRALLRRHFIGFVFQGFQLIARTSALENVALPLVYQGVSRAERTRRARAALAEVGLEGREGHTPAELSGGQQQRVAIARALVTGPKVVLADEPTGNLDSARRAEIHDLLLRLNQQHGITVVIVTHEPEVAVFAPRVITLRDGRVIADGTGVGK